MKTVSLFIATFFIVLSSSVQYNNNNNNRRNNNTSVVTITLAGNANEQVSVDGRNYSSGYGNTPNNTITISDLQPGQHTLQVTSNQRRGNRGGILNRRNNNNNNISTTFNLRSGYDMHITLNGNGRAQLRETRSANYRNNRNNRYNK